MSSMNPANDQTMAQQDPGHTLGIVGLVLSIVGSFVGLIISIVAFNQSKKAGFHNGLAKAGIIVGVITTVLTLAYVVFAIAFAASSVGTLPSR